ncbi:hypothetical protein F5Y12DRAFT_422011 [Xylaria sp. FL1777]|nr:hypothetical protein F5Y12DRAFT_422011 [Xylaria sp. FL1777]
MEYSSTIIPSSTTNPGPCQTSSLLRPRILLPFPPPRQNVSPPDFLKTDRGTFKCTIEAHGEFLDLRSLKRHIEKTRSHGALNGLTYRCCCGKRSSRKDVHMRHLRGMVESHRCSRCCKLKSRCKGHCSPVTFVCVCGREDEKRKDHEGHYQHCQLGQKGRPRTTF